MIGHSKNSWICCQIGAREHYSIARACQQVGMLDRLITDAWVQPGTLIPFQYMPGLMDRFHSDIPVSKIKAFNLSLLMNEAKYRLFPRLPWDCVVKRNSWFQNKAIQYLKRISNAADKGQITLFSYSYAAEKLFLHAKESGWRTILCQIDPGPVEEDIVAEQHAKYPGFSSAWQRAPHGYWDGLRREWDLADIVMVNSEWTHEAMAAAAFPVHKAQVVPLVYECSSPPFSRTYPPFFSTDRRLRVLFLGSVDIRKGVAQLLEAAALLEDEPIEFIMAGPVHLNVPKEYKMLRNVSWIGKVPRSLTHEYYQQADLFILPTHSDGFALTQLEAQRWKLPVLASLHCGRVVTDLHNGMLLEAVTGDAIADALRQCVTSPELLAKMSANALSPVEFKLDKLVTWMERIS